MNYSFCEYILNFIPLCICDWYRFQCAIFIYNRIVIIIEMTQAGRLTKAGSSATMVPREEVMPHLKRVVQVHQQGAKPGMRMREFINSIGFEEFQKRVSQLLEVSPNG